MRLKPAIVGIAGTALTADERSLLQTHQPAGVILFTRNIENPDQLKHLAAELRTVLPADAVLLVDQEGGRVARLRPPHWRAHPPAASLRTPRAAWLAGALIGLDCADFDVVCAPVLDLPQPGAHAIIGDRAFAATPAAIIERAAAFAAGLLAAGRQPVGKHAPGHGRARVDSHLALPRVTATAADLEADLEPFIALAHLPWMMTAHICYAAWDAPNPATLSPVVIQTIIRRRIGFDGVLVTDDLAMHALTGSPGARARAALAAGCDLALHCSGILADTADVLAAIPPLTEAAAARLAAARALADRSRIPLDPAALDAERATLLA